MAAFLLSFMKVLDDVTGRVMMMSTERRDGFHQLRDVQGIPRPFRTPSERQGVDDAGRYPAADGALAKMECTRGGAYAEKPFI